MVPQSGCKLSFCDVAYMSAVCRRACSVPPPLGCLRLSSSLPAGKAIPARCMSVEGAWLGLPWRTDLVVPPRCSLRRWLEWSLERSLERPLRTPIRSHFVPKSSTAPETVVVIARHDHSLWNRFTVGRLLNGVHEYGRVVQARPQPLLESEVTI